MARKVTKLFKLRTNSDHYVEFQNGLDMFRFEFRWNDLEEKYALTLYKNYQIVLNSYFLVWSLNDLFDAFKYLGIGSLRVVTEEGKVDEEGRYVYEEVHKDNLHHTIFRWDYEVI